MYIALFTIGLITGLILGTGITVIWYDDEDLKKLIEDKKLLNDNDAKKNHG